MINDSGLLSAKHFVNEEAVLWESEEIDFRLDCVSREVGDEMNWNSIAFICALGKDLDSIVFTIDNEYLLD